MTGLGARTGGKDVHKRYCPRTCTRSGPFLELAHYKAMLRRPTNCGTFRKKKAKCRGFGTKLEGGTGLTVLDLKEPQVGGPCQPGSDRGIKFVPRLRSNGGAPGTSRPPAPARRKARPLALGPGPSPGRGTVTLTRQPVPLSSEYTGRWHSPGGYY
eukprot:437796-Rhodomonas_salina.8